MLTLSLCSEPLSIPLIKSSVVADIGLEAIGLICWMDGMGQHWSQCGGGVTMFQSATQSHLHPRPSSPTMVLNHQFWHLRALLCTCVYYFIFRSPRATYLNRKQRSANVIVSPAAYGAFEYWWANPASKMAIIFLCPEAPDLSSRGRCGVESLLQRPAKLAPHHRLPYKRQHLCPSVTRHKLSWFHR